MPRPSKGKRLGGSPAHERLILANLATALFEHGRITTTESRARRLRPVAERLVSFAKKGDLHARRRVLTVIRDKGVVHTLFAEIGPRYDNREGGYTRITKIAPRKGDNAPMAVIELVEALVETPERAARAQAKADRKAAEAAATALVATSLVSEEEVTETQVDEVIESVEEEAAAVEVEAIEAEVAVEEVAVEEVAVEEVAEAAVDAEAAPADGATSE